MFAVPVLVLAAVVLAQSADGALDLAFKLLTPGVALAALTIVIVLFGWRLFSMAEAMISVGARGSWRRPTPLAVFAVLALVVGGMHVYAGSVALSLYRVSTESFVTDPRVNPPPGPSAPLASGGATPGPIETPPTAQSRINVLLAGVDSSEARSQALTDTLLVVSIDPATGAVAMVSFPRDIARFELWDGRTYTGKINSLMSWAERHPDEFTDGPLPSVSRAVGHILGVPIHYYAAVDLAGFARMIDRVGGVSINNPTAINDPGYGGWTDGRVGFSLSKGRHTLDGQTALAYVRTRKGAGDNDFNRSRRQQQLLIALQRALVQPAMLPNLPGLLGDLQGTVTTNFPPDRLSQMLDIAQAIDEKAIERVVLGPPYARRPTDGLDGGLYTLRLDMERVATLSRELFGDDSRYASN